MILFLTDRAEGKRGGELSNARLFEFFREFYDEVFPEQLPRVTGELKSPGKHAKYKLEMAKKYNPDLAVVDISAAYRNIRAVRWLKKRRKKIMTVFFGRRMAFRYNIKLNEMAVRLCENYILKKSDIIYANSNYSANLISRKLSKGANVIIIRPGMAPISTDNKAIDIGSRNRQRPLRLLFVGACTKVKGLEYLAEALTLIRDSDFVLHVAGEYNVKDTYFRKVKNILEKGGIADKVEFHGFVKSDGLFELYQESSIFVMPSLSEGYGRVLEEALGFGLPVVATKAGAIPEIVKDGENAILVEARNPQVLADAIAELGADPERMDRMSRKNFERSRYVQTWETYTEDLKSKIVPAIEEIAGIRPNERVATDRID